ncbi:hypothetical protein [Aureimonas psammosilenae]|uniref:hypothetical protein n=1 Tax=Aureimonas psammosilenae TaxID=2495496 RepID=UPI0018698FDA|nr:hypothetical protein [Aureimonas psammosilenae]
MSILNQPLDGGTYDSPHDTPAAKARRKVVGAMMQQQMGYPSIPTAPAQSPMGMSPMAAGPMAGMAGGAMMGGAVGGPVGGLLGGIGGAVLGGAVNRARMGSPSQGAQNALGGGWDGFSQGGGTMPAAPVRANSATPMDPHSASLAKGQRSIDEQRRALASSQPQNLGQGIAALGEGFNLAMRQRAQNQAAADPWSGMRETTTGAAGGGFDLGGALKRIFG